MEVIKDNGKLNIAMIGHKMVPSRRGGIELVLTTLCPLLALRGYHITCFNRSKQIMEKEYQEDVQNQSYRQVKLVEVPTVHKKGLAAFSSSVFASFCAALGNYDIVHYHAEGPGAMLWIPKLFGKRCIATVHGLDWKREKWNKSFASRYIRFGERMIAQYADDIIVLSKGVKEYFKDTYHRETTLIPNGVTHPQNRNADLILEKFGLEKDTYFCALSRLTEEKGLHYLIEAYRQINTGKKLVIAGEASDTDEYVAKLKKMAADNSNIIFTGFVSGKLLDELYSNTYVYVIPSNLEGMPLSLLEAMSYGNAVLGSDISEITDVVEDKAIIFRKGNVKELADKLQYLSDHPETVSRLKAQSADFICEKYNWNEIADQTVKLYKKVVSGKEQETSYG